MKAQVFIWLYFLNEVCSNRSLSAHIFINVAENGSLLLSTHPPVLNHELSSHVYNYNLDDVLEISVGPRDNYDGIKSCLTYNPPDASKPGYQTQRGVRVLETYKIKSINNVINFFAVRNCSKCLGWR